MQKDMVTDGETAPDVTDTGTDVTDTGVSEGGTVGIGELTGIDPSTIDGLEGANVGDKLNLVVNADVSGLDENGLMTLTIQDAQMGNGSEVGMGDNTGADNTLTDAMLSGEGE